MNRRGFVAGMLALLAARKVPSMPAPLPTITLASLRNCHGVESSRIRNDGHWHMEVTFNRSVRWPPEWID